MPREKKPPSPLPTNLLTTGSPFFSRQAIHLFIYLFIFIPETHSVRECREKNSEKATLFGDLLAGKSTHSISLWINCLRSLMSTVSAAEVCPSNRSFVSRSDEIPRECAIGELSGGISPAESSAPFFFCKIFHGYVAVAGQRNNGKASPRDLPESPKCLDRDKY